MRSRMVNDLRKKWLLKPWMNTRTLRSGLLRTELLNQVSAVDRSISCALIVAKSVFGSGGSLRGQARSPTLRTLSGGIDTVKSAWKPA